MCRWCSSDGSSGSSLMPSTNASSGASTHDPVAAVSAPASAYSSRGKTRWGESSTVTRRPEVTRRWTSAGTTGARRSVERASWRTQTCGDRDELVGIGPLSVRRGACPKSALDHVALADDGDATLGDAEAAPQVLLVVDPDEAAVGDHDVLVDDRVAHDRALADLDVVEQDAAEHGRVVGDVAVDADDAGVDRGSGHD